MNATKVENTTEGVVVKKSWGTIYKETMGISKTFRNNMYKQGLNPQDEVDRAKYKQIRKARKKKEKAVSKKKLDANQRYRREHPRKKSKKGGAKKSTEAKPILTS